MKSLPIRYVFCTGLILLLLCIGGCSWFQHNNNTIRPIAIKKQATVPVTTPTSQPPRPGPLSSDIDQLAQKVLSNISQHGWNPQARTKDEVTGGLFTNWQMDDPSHTNFLKEGNDDVTAGKHDTQVDLYYLNALAEYKSLHADDHQFDTDLAKALKMVKMEFADYNLFKGWIYFFLLRDGLLLHDDELVNDARMAAGNYYSNWYDSKLGLIYNRRANPGNFNVEHTLNCGAALIDAGVRWHEDDWLQTGETVMDHTISAALDPQYHLFYNELLINNGQVEIKNHQAKPSTQSNGALALLTAYNLTHQQRYLDTANTVLHSMFDSSLWDQQYQGLFFALDLSTGRLQQSYKETRSQTLSLIALSRYNQLMSQQGKPVLAMDKQQELANIISKDFYQSTYHGFFYRMTPDYKIYRGERGLEKYFTTEAMGTALDALQQTEFTQLPC